MEKSARISFRFCACALCVATAIVLSCIYANCAHADALEAAPAQEDSGGTVRVLFVGNSFTYYKGSGIPALFKSISKANGHPVVVKRLCKRQAFLSDYIFPKAGNASYRKSLQKRLSDGVWDYIIIQERGLRSAMNMPVKMYSSVRALKSIIARYQPSARVLLYSTHGHDGVATVNGKVLSATEMELWSQSACTTVGEKLGIEVVPVGMYFERYKWNHPKQSLLKPDGKHPSVRGYFLAACAFYEAIFGSAPTARAEGALSSNAATDAKLQQAAFDTMGNSLSVNPTYLTLSVGESAHVAFETVDSQVSVASLDDSIAGVSSDGTVTGRKAGRTTIYFRTDSGLLATCAVSVESSALLSSKLSIKTRSSTLTVGNSLDLGVQKGGLRVSNSLDDYDIVWSSSNPAAASVDEVGVVTALRGGRSTITARDTLSGASASCVVYVRFPASRELTARGSTSSLRISWAGVARAKKYYVYRSKGSGSFKYLATTKTKSYVDKKVKRDVRYCYRVVAANGLKKCMGTASDKVSGIVLSKERISVKSSNGNAVVSWKRNSLADGYQVFRKAKGKGPFKLVKTVRSKSRIAWIDPTAKKKATRQYKVRSYRVLGGKKFYGELSRARTWRR